MTNKNEMYNTELLKIIFPIVRQDSISKKSHLFGTGFFIAEQGLFMTAKHVLRGFVEKSTERNPTDIFALLSNNSRLHSIIKVFWKNDSDVAVALLDRSSHKNEFLKLSHPPCQKGDRIFTYAFPASRIEQMEDLSQPLPVPEYFSGTLEEEFPKGRDRRMLPNPCWKTSLPIHAGASGGPVFNQEGRVIGLTNSSLNIDPSCSFVSSLAHIMDLEISGIDLPGFDKKEWTLKELMLIAS